MRWSKVQGPRLNYLHGESKPPPPEYVHLYISGFSCKPFSTLHHNSQLLDEPEARIFWAVVNRIRCIKPPAFLLENVQGITRCLPEVLAAMESNGLYLVSSLHMDPSQLGEPVQRPRIYFFGRCTGHPSGTPASSPSNLGHCDKSRSPCHGALDEEIASKRPPCCS